MFYVYLLENKSREHYIGCTANLDERIKLHNSNKILSTRNKRPFEIIYYEAYKSKEDAFHREKNLKLRANAFTGLQRRLIKSIGKAL